MPPSNISDTIPIDSEQSTLSPSEQSKWLQKIAAWISRKEYTQYELQQRLDEAGLPSHHQQTLIQRVSELGWLSDERVAQSTLDRKQGQWGKQRLQYHLKQRGIDAQHIELVTANLDEESEQQRALALWTKKFKGTLPQTPQEQQRHMRFLISRGFSIATASTVMRLIKQQEQE